MTAATLNFILSMVTILLTGTNIVSLVQIKSLKRKGGAEADRAEIDNLLAIITMQGNEIERLSKRLSQQEEKNDNDRKHYEERITAMQNQYDVLLSALRASGVQIQL